MLKRLNYHQTPTLLLETLLSIEPPRGFLGILCKREKIKKNTKRKRKKRKRFMLGETENGGIRCLMHSDQGPFTKRQSPSCTD